MEAALLSGRQSKADLLQALLLGLTLLSLVLATLASTAVAITSWSYIRQLRAQSDALQAEAASRRDAESRLLQTQKLELVGQLTAGIAHDFNNLLTIVIGNLDTARRRIEQGHAADSGRLAKPVDTAAEGARRAAGLTQKLLAFARQQPLRRPTRSQQGGRKHVRRADPHGRRVGEDRNGARGGVWPAFADPGHVDNAIVNLVVNARDAMPDGGHITIETANAWLSEHYVAQFGDVSPANTCSVGHRHRPRHTSGHPAAGLEPFFTTKDVGKGTGLGLATIHGFVKQSKGHIRIYSEPGQGTTVKVYLPRMTDAAVVATTPEIQELSDAAAPGVRGRRGRPHGRGRRGRPRLCPLGAREPRLQGACGPATAQKGLRFCATPSVSMSFSPTSFFRAASMADASRTKRCGCDRDCRSSTRPAIPGTPSFTMAGSIPTCN